MLAFLAIKKFVVSLNKSSYNRNIPKPMVSQGCKLLFRNLLLRVILSFNIVDSKSCCTIAFIMKTLVCNCENLKFRLRRALEILASSCLKKMGRKSSFEQQNLPYGRLSEQTSTIT